MATSSCEISRCGLCRFYTHEGRRGGHCSQLSAPVNARWTACCFSEAPFTDRPKVSPGIAKWAAATNQIRPKQISSVLVPADASKKPADASKKIVCSAIAN